jgi:hypothetical protein
MIGYCGLVCSECDAYIATKKNDDELARRTAGKWSEMFQKEIKVRDIWCDGCLVGGKKCIHCRTCEIRACGQQNGVENCGKCRDYPCEMLEDFFKFAPYAKTNLDKIAN